MSSRNLFDGLRNADPGLLPLMEKLHTSLNATPIDLVAVKGALVEVLEFLASPKERTDANCSAVDLFLMHDDAWDSERLPEEYAEILAHMSDALHDTVSAPEIAKNFGSTPEQLLVKALEL
jgi:hypothetical protein